MASRPSSVNPAFVAVEGTFDELARASISRRVASLTGIVSIVVVVGVLIAAVLGGIVGAVAEIVGGAIG